MLRDNPIPTGRSERAFVGSIFGLIGVLTMATASTPSPDVVGGVLELAAFLGVLYMILG